MDNVNFDASGEDIERALMDLGPLLGVAIKEEVPDELAAPAVPAAPPSVVSACDGAEGERPGADSAERADSLASPRAGAALSAARCALCSTALALAHGTPKLMECLHSACESCINAKIEEKQASRDFCGGDRITVQCPVCRLQCQPANMIDQRFVLEKMCPDTPPAAAERDQHCSSCEEPEPATSYCTDCAEFICDSCVQAHQRLKITKDHTIKSKEEAIQEQQASQPAAHDMFCTEHPQERLSLFCETCDRLTCRDCQLQHHRDHKYQFSTEMAQQARAHIASLLSEVSYKRVLLGSAMKVIRERQVLIADKKKALVHEITQTVVKLTNAINTRGKQLVLRLNEVCDGKQRTLSEKKDALEQLANITDHCVEFVSAALQQGSDTAVLYSKRAVCAHLQRIKSRRADIPNPEIPVRIALALDKLPDLVKVLSSIGAIVVDGKVDGGGAAAQGPYHPPAPQPPAVAPAPAPAPAAVSAALHHAAAMQQTLARYQSYANAGMGGVGGYMSALASLRTRPHGAHAAHALQQHTPLRHAHVTSTTHPHHLHGMSELNLRGLLNQGSGRGAARSPLQPHPAMHHYQQIMGAYANSAYAAAAAAGGGGRRSGGPRTPSPAPHAPPHTPPAPPAQLALSAMPAQPAKWHIPQQGLVNGGFDMSSMSHGAGSPAGAGADFKITLGRARAAPPSAVTSTNPKTPSPSLNGGAGVELDKVCAESVQDLMATIAKLDSNGVQVLPEQPRAEPAVHSSTDTAGGTVAPTAAAPAATSGDPNEDWCAVCMDGGELMCCDKCPKVFHQYCHIPTIEKLPDETETWQCLLCVNFAELPEEPRAPGETISPREQKLMERVTLELYCQYESSLPFREPVPQHNHEYHSKISRPMCLDMIRMKLQPRSPTRYAHVAHFVADVRLMFRNARLYNPPESQIHKDAIRLEQFFDISLEKWLPTYAYWSGEGSPPAKRARTD
ncbi:E3 ubiquitin-protein ligase TRIM33 [Leguminivora glycinivorella]|uniref:E3 ubiquitin-protein ligase TRIM33 n=1 Tax=Leguminivora glycinivorella TaxID=1035111 RepID=UPI0020103313|nr:E3 ubiquitin-protein ligase TRIM33 [Leguminivora glycinivorella]